MTVARVLTFLAQWTMSSSTRVSRSFFNNGPRFLSDLHATIFFAAGLLSVFVVTVGARLCHCAGGIDDLF